MYRTLITFALVAAVTCNDLIQGPEGGRKIYEANQEATPAIWKQKQEFTIKTNESEVISRIVIQDRRPQKDGEAKIVSGGQGQRNVTIELSSPTVFRGYDFHVEVYAAEDNGQQIAYPEERPMDNDTAVNYDAKKDEESSTDVVTEARTDGAQDKVQPPVSEGQDKVVDLVTADRKVRKTETDSDNPIAPVNGNKSADEDVTETGPVITKVTVDPKMTTEKAVTQNAPGQASDSPLRPQMTAEEEFIKLYGMEAFKHFRGESSEEMSTTEESVVTEKVQPRDFTDVSKTLGQNVVFGIKRV